MARELKDYVLKLKEEMENLLRCPIEIVEDENCPVFWIDMAMLYEHYVLGLLREAYGSKIY